MKRKILILTLLLACSIAADAQHKERTTAKDSVITATMVSGTVTNGRQPLAGANVFVKGTTDGCLTDSLGRFSFTTASTDSAVLMVTCIGYDDCQHVLSKGQRPLTIVMRECTTTIDEVVVTGSTFSFGQANGMKQMDALDVVLDGGSCGDIVAALQSLLGGYDAEYGQALSSVLPMETTDAAASDKLGVSASLIDWNIGGTKATKAGSWSMNAAYTDLGLYNRLFPTVGRGTSLTVSSPVRRNGRCNPRHRVCGRLI